MVDEDQVGLLDRLRIMFPANRVAAIFGFLTSLALALTALQSSFVPGSPPAEAIAKAAGFIGGLAGAVAVVLKFMQGSQNFDKLLLGANDQQVEGENVTVVNNAPVESEKVGDDAIDLPDHPQNDSIPNKELTEEDVERDFGTVEPLPPGPADVGGMPQGFHLKPGDAPGDKE